MSLGRVLPLIGIVVGDGWALLEHFAHHRLNPRFVVALALGTVLAPLGGVLWDRHVDHVKVAQRKAEEEAASAQFEQEAGHWQLVPGPGGWPGAEQAIRLVEHQLRERRAAARRAADSN